MWVSGLALLLAAVVLDAASVSVNPDLVNTNVIRKVDISTHLLRINTLITFANNGKSSVNSYLFSLEPQLASKLSYIGASVVRGKDELEKIKVTETKVDKQGDFVFYLVHLNKQVEPNSELTIEVEGVYTHTLQPYPSHILQSEKQFVKFLGNLYFFSPYTTKSQTALVICSSANIDSHTKQKPFSVSDKVITYGPFENVEPFKEFQLMVHYENNSPFLTVTRMTRVIEVSHWGNIAIEETFEMLHSGAVLKGSFSRYDYQRAHDSSSSIRSFKTLLPASARDVYYRDEIGNISTSSLREMEDGLELELRPRFPLFGGWKTSHYIGYNVPSYQYLYNKGDNFALVMKFMDHIFDDQVVDEIVVKIILPEGSKDIKLKTPYNVERAADSLHATYLDTVGRPVITISKKNLVEQHIQDFELHYTFSKFLLIQEPLLVFAAFFLLFISIIIYVRLDFSITKDEASDLKLRLASLVKQTVELHERRSALYQSYEDAINKYKSSKDASAFKNAQKRIDADHKQLSLQVAALHLKLKTEGSDSAEKVQELQRLDGQVKDQIALMVSSAERLVGGRMAKQAYLDHDANIRSKKDDICNKMDTILSSM